MKGLCASRIFRFSRIDRLAGQVHKCLRLQQHDLGATQATLAELRLKFAFPRRKPVIRGNLIQSHKADIVAIAGIFAARIAETDEKFHAGVFLANYVMSVLP